MASFRMLQRGHLACLRKLGHRGLSSEAVVYPAPKAGVDWKSMGFSMHSKDTKMVVANCAYGGQWDTMRAEPYGPMDI